MFRAAALLLLGASLPWIATDAAEAAGALTVEVREVPDYKAVFGTVESVDQTTARARIAGTVEDLAIDEGSKRLALLAPDIVEAILAGRSDQALMLEKVERPLLASWEAQRSRLA